jgi:tRNA(Ile)-lysidine synthase
VRTGVAVSGGADSVYLLYEVVAAGAEVVVLHVNHLLRGAESDGDEEFVRGLAGALGLECLVLREAPGDGNLEAEARAVRYRWFGELIRAGVVERVAVGHTLSDQAETVLFRFLRGAGTAGLAGIRPVRRDGIYRPLLGIRREAVRESLRQRGISWREDSSNNSGEFARNRIRGELLPQLEREWNPELTRALGQMADWAQEEEKYWARRMKKLAARYFLGDGVVRWPKGLGVAVERRLVRHAIETVAGHVRQIEYGHVEAVRAMRSGKLNLPGVTVEKSFEWLRFTAAGAGEPDPREFDPRVRLALVEAGSVYNGDKHQLDWGSLSGRLELRRWQAGDRYQRAGRLKEERLKLLFQRARVPVWERRSWPVLICGDKIVWTRGFGVAAGLERTANTEMVLLVRGVSGFPNLNS